MDLTRIFLFFYKHLDMYNNVSQLVVGIISNEQNGSLITLLMKHLIMTVIDSANWQAGFFAKTK